LNIADEYAAAKDGGGGWRDTHIRIDGEEPARTLTSIFEETWKKAEPYLVRHHTPKQAPKNDYLLPTASIEDWTLNKIDDEPRAKFTGDKLPLVILSNRELIMRLRIKRAYLKAIRAAQCYILIENAFFIPDRDVLRALYRAVKRGVKVAVVVAMKHDIRIAAMAARALYDELLSNGVRLFEYPISMIHSKVAAIDDRWSIVSSYNLNHRSLLHDLEVGALFCNELTKEIHRSRAWNIALTESVCYQFRYWL
jgi:cardiolipin synthase